MFDDDGPLGTNLTDRIKMINRRFSHEEAKTESLAEDNMIEVSKENEAPVEEMAYYEDVCDEPSMPSSEYKVLCEKVDTLTAEIKKMNKHINSIVKYIKKADK